MLNVYQNTVKTRVYEPTFLKSGKISSFLLGDYWKIIENLG